MWLPHYAYGAHRLAEDLMCVCVNGGVCVLANHQTHGILTTLPLSFTPQKDAQ